MAKKADSPLPTNFVEISVGNICYFRILISGAEEAFGLKSVTTNTNHRKALEAALRSTQLGAAVRGMHITKNGVRLPTPMPLVTILPAIMVAMEQEFRQPPRAVKNVFERPECRPAQFIATPKSVAEIGWKNY